VRGAFAGKLVARWRHRRRRYGTVPGIRSSLQAGTPELSQGLRLKDNCSTSSTLRFSASFHKECCWMRPAKANRPPNPFPVPLKPREWLSGSEPLQGTFPWTISYCDHTRSHCRYGPRHRASRRGLGLDLRLPGIKENTRERNLARVADALAHVVGIGDNEWAALRFGSKSFHKQVRLEPRKFP
jgi:hypothetical protein